MWQFTLNKTIMTELISGKYFNIAFFAISFWTPYDLMIFPAHSSRLSVGKEISIPVLLHAWMVKDSKVLTTIKETLLE